MSCGSCGFCHRYGKHQWQCQHQPTQNTPGGNHKWRRKISRLFSCSGRDSQAPYLTLIALHFITLPCFGNLGKNYRENDRKNHHFLSSERPKVWFRSVELIDTTIRSLFDSRKTRMKKNFQTTIHSTIKKPRTIRWYGVVCAEGVPRARSLPLHRLGAMRLLCICVVSPNDSGIGLPDWPRKRAVCVCIEDPSLRREPLVSPQRKSCGVEERQGGVRGYYAEVRLRKRRLCGHLSLLPAGVGRSF